MSPMGFEEHLQDSPPPSTQQSKITSFELSPTYKSDANPFLKKIDSGFHSKSLRNDTSMLAHSSAQFKDLNSSYSSTVSTKSALPDIKKQLRFFEGGTSQDFLIFKPPRRTNSHRLVNEPATNTFSDDLDNLSQRTKGLTTAQPYTMPLLRKMSREDSPSPSLDISHLSVEHSGLGIITTCERGGHQSDVVTNLTSRRNFPSLTHRSTSGTSQHSLASSSSMNKPGSQNLQQLHQATCSYTPTSSQSYQTSIFESDGSGKPDFVEGDLLGRSGSDTFYPSVLASSGQAPRLSLQMHDNSFTRLPGISQTNITCRSSFGYSRDNGSTLDTASPISRSSLDFVFRARTRTSTDPISRAATVQAARQAFEEKEAAKTRRFEELQMKAAEKQMRRKDKQHWRASLRDEEAPTPVWAKVPQETLDLPGASDPISPISQPGPNSGSWKSQSKSKWMLFLTWLRTRIFKLRGRIRNLG
ncbi:hypothetical protein BDV28DRAFT_143198 [Aspergillus coremiiformis]|uniref:Uncharacterized protein n=1 Tax=Aspergillus coremiiformis TaxID=138285 RepID=A0A5N6YT15_9EURO|nr:hypothetical protein BDV28DRAFT_143198 [Aspergillus coremiiformis]